MSRFSTKLQQAASCTAAAVVPFFKKAPFTNLKNPIHINLLEELQLRLLLFEKGRGFKNLLEELQLLWLFKKRLRF